MTDKATYGKGDGGSFAQEPQSTTYYKGATSPESAKSQQPAKQHGGDTKAVSYTKSSGEGGYPADTSVTKQPTNSWSGSAGKDTSSAGTAKQQSSAGGAAPGTGKQRDGGVPMEGNSPTAKDGGSRSLDENSTASPSDSSVSSERDGENVRMETDEADVQSSSVADSVILQARASARVPVGGLSAEGRRGDIDIARLQTLASSLRDPAILEHVRRTVGHFVEDTDERSALPRSAIDLPMTLAVAVRESGPRLTFSTSQSRIVSAGRDAHTEGRSGLDWLYDQRSHFPPSIRQHILPVDESVPGRKLRECNPAFLRECDLLAGFVVELAQRAERFLRRFHGFEFSEDAGFTREERDLLLARMTPVAKRAWTQAAFGSRLSDLLIGVRGAIRQSRQHGASFESIVEDDRFNLNAIIVDDELLQDSWSRQRTRISACEALIVESFIQDI